MFLGVEDCARAVSASIAPAEFCFMLPKSSFYVRGDAGVDAPVRTAHEIHKIRHGPYLGEGGYGLRLLLFRSGLFGRSWLLRRFGRTCRFRQSCGCCRAGSGLKHVENAVKL